MSSLVTILGIGESGIGAAMLAQARGYQVFMSDKSSDLKSDYLRELDELEINYELGQHSEDRILSSDVIIKSPGIPAHIPILQKAKEQGLTIMGEIEWGYRNLNPGAQIIAITGSNGKTTTTTLCYQILKDSELSVASVGNIGYSLCRQIALKPRQYYVLEVSSFQLDDVIDFRPHISILLNITPDHLDRYDYDIQKYADSKFRILKNQTDEDFFIHNLDDELSQETLLNLQPIKPKEITFSMNKAFEENHNGESYVDNDGKLIIKVQGKSDFDIAVEKLGLRGKHNVYNSMAAAIPARIMDLRNDRIRKSLMDYKGLEHRLEFVKTVSHVDYINDSKATNLNSVWYALECMVSPTVLILGGVDKGNDYNLILDLVQEKVKGIIALGIDNEKIVDFFGKNNILVKEAATMGSAVQLAADLALPGDTVLLSPACASFDLFDNYEDRGNQFKIIVNSL